MNPINISPKWKVSSTSLRRELQSISFFACSADTSKYIFCVTLTFESEEFWIWILAGKTNIYIVLESFFSTQLWNSSLDLSIHNTVRLGWDDKKKHQPTCFQERARPCGKAKLPKIHWLLPIFALGICCKHNKLLQPVNIHYSGAFYFIFL